MADQAAAAGGPVNYQLINADVLVGLATLADRSIQTCVTSPPYWGLRDYGIEPSVWGGDPEHDHAFGAAVKIHKGGPAPGKTSAFANGNRAVIGAQAAMSDRIVEGLCECGAWRGCLGLEPTPELFVQHVVLVFREVWRVLRDDGTLWLNLGDSYATGAGAVGNSPGGGKQGERWARGVATNGRGEPQAKRKGSNRAQRGDGNDGVGYGPMTQPNRMPQIGLKTKDLVGIPWMVAFALRADGWYLRSDIVWNKPNPMPESVRDRPTKAHEYLFLLAKQEKYFYDCDSIREPAAYIGPNSPDAIKSPYGQGFTRRAHNPTPSGWDVAGHGRAGLVGRYSETNAKAKGNEKTFRGGGAYTAGQSFDNGADVDRDSHGNEPNESGTRNKRSVWTVATAPFPEAHFATFPPDLIEPCILAGTSPTACGTCGAPWKRVTEVSYTNPGNRTTNGPRSAERKHQEFGTAGYAQRLERQTETKGWDATCEHDDPSGTCQVLDPFSGSGTTGEVALSHQRDYVGIERNPEYVAMSRRRLRAVAPMFATESFVADAKSD